ncbi:MAG: hypothetical protein U0X76_05280 [Bacteroidia bacterium]
MKKEYLLTIRNSGAGKSSFTPERHLEFVRQCEVYIKSLREKDNLIAAQPILRNSIILSKDGNNWKWEKIDESTSFQVGYYHLRAESIEHAIELAKQNPEFAYVENVQIEIREIKTKESATGFEYPKGIK